MMKRRSVRALYHAIPLHYLPSLLAAGALYAQSVLSAAAHGAVVPGGIRPRATASRRDRMLGLGDFVHLSTSAGTPLLADKIRKGYPHALLIFDGGLVFDLPEVAVLPYNTKAWRTRACYVPVTEPFARRALLDRHLEGRRLPSLEILVKYGLPLTCLTSVAFLDDRERIASERAVRDRHAAFVTAPEIFPAVDGYAPACWEVIQAYFDRCRRGGRAMPPAIPFD